MKKTADIDVLLLAAGYGKRLMPLTRDLPKPLVAVQGKPLIEWNLELLAAAGFRRIFINLFYLGEKIRAALGDGSKWGVELLFVDEPLLLDTGGAVKNIQPHLHSDHLLTVNSDILLGRDFSFDALLRQHWSGSPLATLALREDDDAEHYGILECDAAGRIISLRGTRLPEEVYTPLPPVHSLMYMGVQILDCRILDGMPERGTAFSLTRDTFRTLIQQGKYLNSIQYQGFFSDIGTPDRLRNASNSYILK
jgi:NDP-sugar pyrophosphorylase family protein